MNMKIFKGKIKEYNNDNISMESDNLRIFRTFVINQI